jgi:predicted TIM-barrel fold metal-dependent hydrolase
MMHETVKKNPNRLKPVAIVPPWGDKDCLYELERCVKELGCVAVEMAAHYGSVHPDEEIIRPHWKKINELGVPVIVHHTPLPAEYQSFYTTDKRRLLGRCFAQITCATRLLFSGLYDEFPDQKVIHSYMGGGFFAFTDIMNMKSSGKYKEEMKRVPNATRMGDQFERYLKNNVYFDMCHATPWGKRHMEFAIEVLGADHVLFGTSYPLRKEWAYEGANFIRGLDINEDEKALVLGGNAERLFKLS